MKKHSKKWLLIKITASLGITLVIIIRVGIGYFSASIDSNIDIMVKNYIEDVVIDSVDNSFLKEASTGGLLIQKYDSNGKIAYAYLDTLKVNKIRNRLASYMNEVVDEIGNTDSFNEVSIPLSYFFGNLFNGGSINIPITLDTIGNEDVDLVTDVKASGINTSIFELSLEITIEVVAFMPLKRTNIVSKMRLPLAFEVINGEVPLYLG